ncbi:MAG: hypothetical protein JSS98_04365 [Bacteroidetes bacterium]|nr:hypothetical protein [Bacteroidota bacterium]
MKILKMNRGNILAKASKKMNFSFPLLKQEVIQQVTIQQEEIQKQEEIK